MPQTYRIAMQEDIQSLVLGIDGNHSSEPATIAPKGAHSSTYSYQPSLFTVPHVRAQR